MSMALNSILEWFSYMFYLQISLRQSGGLILCVGFYFYLDALYLVDEILEGDALRELTIEEKTTIVLRQVTEECRILLTIYSLSTQQETRCFVPYFLLEISMTLYVSD